MGLRMAMQALSHALTHSLVRFALSTSLKVPVSCRRESYAS